MKPLFFKNHSIVLIIQELRLTSKIIGSYTQVFFVFNVRLLLELRLGRILSKPLFSCNSTTRVFNRDSVAIF